MIKWLKKLTVLVLICASLTALALPAIADNNGIAYGAATIDASSLNIREGTGTTYSVIGSVKRDAIVVILEKTNDSWYKINHGGIIGYVSTATAYSLKL